MTKNGNGPLLEAFRDPTTGRWLPGCPGRPRGSRVKFSEAFARDFYADWQQHGVEVLERVRRERPADYLKCAVVFLKPYLRELEDLAALNAGPFDHVQTLDELAAHMAATAPELVELLAKQPRRLPARKK